LHETIFSTFNTWNSNYVNTFTFLNIDSLISNSFNDEFIYCSPNISAKGWQSAKEIIWILGNYLISKKFRIKIAIFDTCKALLFYY
jgi:hypothetical protein